MSDPVSIENLGSIALVCVDAPPVNALSYAVRAGMQNAFAQLSCDDEIEAIVLYCRGRTFIAGADIREFGQPPRAPLLPELIDQIEACAKPVVAALHGTALGGGLEVAMGAHYRVAAASAQFGLPEVTLGLLPGAGGTQRLPRLVPMIDALDMISSGKMIDSNRARHIGLIDRIADSQDMRHEGLAFARHLLANNSPPRPTRARPCQPADAALFAQARTKAHKSNKGQLSPLKAIEALENATRLDFSEGLAQERALFLELMGSEQRGALIHAFFAQRQVTKIPETQNAQARTIERIGVIGGGTMGAGIAASALLAGLDVTLAEREIEAAERAQKNVSHIIQGAVKRAKLSAEQADILLTQNFRAVTDYHFFRDADLVIEAVFESMQVKAEVFGQLDALCKPGAILASNTSYLDLNAIAQTTSRPEDVIGLHFFSPAHVMKLLEVVVGEHTAPDVTASGFALAKRLQKIAVRAGVCDGFIGNRILSHTRKALEGAVLDGASPYAIDRALEDFGLAMGPFAVGDLAGLDIAWANRKRLAPSRDPRERYAEFSDVLCQAGHFGRKSGRGFYCYDAPPQRRPNPDIEAIISAERARKNITPRALSDAEIVARYMAAMVNQAAYILEEGIALRPLDIDVTLLNGYGFPRWRGGPMHYADNVGLDKILADIRTFAADDDFLWQPAGLLQSLADSGKTFASLNQRVKE